MFGGILLGAIIGVMVLIGIAIMDGELRIDGTPLFAQQEAQSQREILIQTIQELDNQELDKEQLEYLAKTLETLDYNGIELTSAEKELLDQIMQMKDKAVTQKDVDMMEISLADDLLKMGLNLKPEFINSLND